MFIAHSVMRSAQPRLQVAELLMDAGQQDRSLRSHAHRVQPAEQVRAPSFGQNILGASSRYAGAGSGPKNRKSFRAKSDGFDLGLRKALAQDTGRFYHVLERVFGFRPTAGF